MPLSAIRLVTYEASAPLRTALAGNQIDFGMVSLEASLGMLKLIKPVAVLTTAVPIHSGRADRQRGAQARRYHG